MRITANPAGLAPGSYRELLNLEPSNRSEDEDEGPRGEEFPPSRLQVTLHVRSGPTLIPLVRDGNSWRTILYITNPEPQPAQFLLRFFRSDGSVWPLSIGGNPAVPTYTASVDSGGLAVVETGAEPSNLIEGWATIEASRPLAVNAILRMTTPEDQIVSTSLPSRRTGSTQWWLPYDSSAPLETRLMLLNPHENQPARITMTYRDTAGRMPEPIRFSYPRARRGF